jgi:hypothetical protein
MSPRTPLQLLAALICVILLAPAARAADEAALLELWQQHIAVPEKHEETITACRSFAAAHPSDPLVPVVQGIEAWHHFSAGRAAEAQRLLEPHLAAPPGPITDAARALARGWITRLDREKVAAALQVHYRKEIAYPKSLEQLASYPKLPPESRPPFADRFGKPWNYRLAGFKTVSGFGDQKYVLQSQALGDLSDLRSAVKAPYASRIQVTPVQIVTTPDGSLAVKFNTGKGGSAMVAVGRASGDLHVAFVGAQIVVVCDHTHWKVLPKL